MYGPIFQSNEWDWPDIAKKWVVQCGTIEAQIQALTKPPEEICRDTLATFHKLEALNEVTIGKRQPETRDELRRVMIAQFKMWTTKLEAIK